MAHDAIDEVVEEASIDELVEQAKARGLFEPGVIYSNDEIPNELYHRGPGISSTNIKHALISPAHYRLHKEHPKPRTSAMHIGEAFHCLVLEPARFEKEFVLSPYDSFRSKEAKTWRAEMKLAGITPLTNSPGADPFWSPGEWDLVHLMRDAIMSHEFAPLFLQHFTAETSIYWYESVDVLNQTGDKVDTMQLLCKARFDVRDMAHHVLADLKTTASAQYSDFIRHVFDFGYHISRQHYVRGARELNIEANEFVFIAIEKEPPYAIGLYTLDENAKRIGDIRRRRGLEAIAAALHFDEWPAYPPQDRQLQTPPWLERQKVI